LPLHTVPDTVVRKPHQRQRRHALRPNTSTNWTVKYLITGFDTLLMGTRHVSRRSIVSNSEIQTRTACCWTITRTLRLRRVLVINRTRSTSVLRSSVERQVASLVLGRAPSGNGSRHVVETASDLEYNTLHLKPRTTSTIICHEQSST
jgi:hypothetical protein